MNNPISLEGKIAIVTGAGRGIGEAIATHLAEQGAHVVVSDRDENLCRNVVNTLQQAGLQASHLALDVTQENAWKDTITSIEAQHGRLDVLVNNAGVFFPNLIQDTDLETYRMMQSINVEGVLLGCKYASQLMQKHASPEQRASIINISSMAGLVGSAGLSSYCASKGAVRLMTKALAAELGALHIRVNSVHPGLIQTEMGDMVKELLKQKLDLPDTSAAHQLGVSLAPLQAWGTPSDVANSVVFLASLASNFITASELVIDGGITGTQ